MSPLGFTTATRFGYKSCPANRISHAVADKSRSQPTDAVVSLAKRLTISLPAFTKLELEAPFTVEDLDAMIISVGNYNLVSCVHSDSGWFRELGLSSSKLSKLAVIDHLLSLDGRSFREHERRDEFGGQIHQSIIVVEPRARVQEIIDTVR